MKKLREILSIIFVVILCIIGAFSIGWYVGSLLLPIPKPTKFIAVDYVDENGNMNYVTGYVSESDYRNLKKNKEKINLYTYEVIYTNDIKSYR